MSSPALTVAEIWRFPVKSLLGERLPVADLGRLGVAGDRGWALVDVPTGAALTAREVPELLFAAARSAADGGVDVVLPDGTVTRDDGALSGWLGRPVGLRRGVCHDNDEFRVTLLSAGTLGGWDRRRFRPNLVLAGAGEDTLVGRRVRVGTAELAVVDAVDRCVLVTRPQAGGIGRDTGVLKTIHRERGGVLAVGAGVPVPGRVAVGDELRPR